MTLLSSPAPPSVRAPSAFLRLPPVNRRSSVLFPNPNPNFNHLDWRRVPEFEVPLPKSRGWTGAVAASNLLEQEASLVLRVDRESFSVREAVTEEEVEAAVRLRIRTFYEFNQASWGLEDHKRCLVEREFEALKDRLSGNRIGFKRVACINAILPLSPSWGLGDELCTTCKFSEDGNDQVVVGTLDLNQCLGLADELTGRRPVGSGTNVMRAYLSNVCVAEELQRNGLGHALVSKSKKVARQWGITDLYVHVAVDNEAAQRLYQKSGFIYEDEEPAWQARFLGRPRRFLLWADLTKAQL